ncbi:MAG: Membrane protein-like protein involved in bacteriocin uptake [Symbiobacteriaceae bacterium]|jgi:hypothetical protein|nr:Membrane protein-like protein involved in bacteriocin uptake [Symbiobacteriaceae bacterium]
MFQPAVDQPIVIEGVSYRFAVHPAAPGKAYGQQGRKGTVYQLIGEADRRALKVFAPHFCQPGLVGIADAIGPFQSLPGLAAAGRTVLTPRRHVELLRKYPELTYAMLMPWVEGATWQEIMLDEVPISPEESLLLARSLAEVLAAMEEQRVAHCDLSAANVLVRPDETEGPPVSLVDLEDMCAPGLPRPAEPGVGSPGYAHLAVQNGFWGVEADRFAGAVLLAEMLGWCDGRVVAAAAGETYFAKDEMQQPCERYRILHTVLSERWGEQAARLFEDAWTSAALRECPPFGMWCVKLPTVIPPLAGEPEAVAEAEQSAAAAADAGAAAAMSQSGAAVLATEPAPAKETDLALAGQYFQEARSAREAGRLAEAKELLQEVLRIAPGFALDGLTASAVLAQVEEAMRPVAVLAPPPRKIPVWAVAAGALGLAVILGVVVWAVSRPAPPQGPVAGSNAAPASPSQQVTPAAPASGMAAAVVEVPAPNQDPAPSQPSSDKPAPAPSQKPAETPKAPVSEQVAPAPEPDPQPTTAEQTRAPAEPEKPAVQQAPPQPVGTPVVINGVPQSRHIRTRTDSGLVYGHLDDVAGFMDRTWWEGSIVYLKQGVAKCPPPVVRVGDEVWVQLSGISENCPLYGGRLQGGMLYLSRP